MPSFPIILRVPFVPFRPQESFGAWLKRHAASGTGHPAAVAAA